ncbi:Scr1 family TA system antitoxin-like transcriptional regulator [Kitasatospora sp. NPDC094016]|uniref:Scr1 family TA system antitoxin-like transcriptional regulator n=1 Tax=Kitasatospora sp. NPDC094016 TaxID=3154986 RepID=UPI00331D6F32
MSRWRTPSRSPSGGPSTASEQIATPEYVDASLALIPGDHSAAIAKKLERQALLREATKSFTFVLTEQACLWPRVPAQAMATQLDHLASLSRLPNVRLGVIPLAGHMPKAPMNVFTVYDASLATVEVATGVLVFRDSHDVRTHLDTFQTFEGYSLWGGDARARLKEWASRHR